MAGRDLPLRITPVSITRARADLLRQADAIVHRLMPKALMRPDHIWQFPVILIPVSATPGHESIVLRPVSSSEAMTASFAPIPWRHLHKIVAELLRLPGIDAVFFDLSHKPPGTIEWE